jgi:peroxiredoxin Q/BCP
MRKFLAPVTITAVVAFAPIAQGATAMPSLVGKPAPEFALPSDRGETVSLAAYRGKQNVLLAFFPKAFTPGCSKEMQDLGKDLPKFKELSTQVLGISYDTPETLGKFAVHCAAEFPFLSDEGGKIAQQYDSAGGMLMVKLPKRRAFLIDKAGTIRQVYEGMPDHARIFKDLEALKNEG